MFYSRKIIIKRLISLFIMCHDFSRFEQRCFREESIMSLEKYVKLLERVAAISGELTQLVISVTLLIISWYLIK